MKARRPHTLRRIVIEMATLVVLHFAFVQILARVRLLEHMLSPGPGSKAALVVTGCFLVLRVVLFIFAPGWFLARLWLWATRPQTE